MMAEADGDMNTNTNYDNIGTDYATTRRPDPRIAALIASCITDLNLAYPVNAHDRYM